jgi:four helix bundle protein
MGGVRCFEDLLAWQRARELTRMIYQTTSLPVFSKDFGLKDQMRRSAVSVMANIAEGFDRNKPTEFHQYLSTAKASCAETRSHLYVALDAEYLDKAAFEKLFALAEETGRIINGLRAAVKRTRDA